MTLNVRKVRNIYSVNPGGPIEFLALMLMRCVFAISISFQKFCIDNVKPVKTIEAEMMQVR